MCAVVLHEYIDDKGKIRHRRGLNIWPTYADAIYEFVDYFDTWYLSTEEKRSFLPPDMRILYETDGLNWDQFMLARNIIDTRLMYDAIVDFNYLEQDFIVGPGVYVYLLEDIPLGFSYLFDSSVLFGGKKGKSKNKKTKKKNLYKLPPGFKNGKAIVAGSNRGSPYKTINGNGSALDELDLSNSYEDSSENSEYTDSSSSSSEFINDDEFNTSDSDIDEDEKQHISNKYGFGGAGKFHLPPSLSGGNVRNFNADVSDHDDIYKISGNGELDSEDESDKDDALNTPPSFQDLRDAYGF